MLPGSAGQRGVGISIGQPRETVSTPVVSEVLRWTCFVATTRPLLRRPRSPAVSPNHCRQAANLSATGKLSPNCEAGVFGLPIRADN